ncbi:DUF2975 domain-containing protein [Clostridium sp. ATCC 25772]|uniref:DUF2975 domain-containing protein n=1 Tax=Clostridium sp. ATCC 25772 TaxID=1676991 RepID=UPI00078031FF|nr:DUF2975 domain-containing protein [Clostridium sp. ATCC 25772]
MRKIKIRGYILALLHLFRFISVIMAIMVILGFIMMRGEPFTINERKIMVFLLVSFCDYTFLTCVSIKIVNCSLNKIFSTNNVKNFKKLGYGMIILALTEKSINISQTAINFDGIIINPSAIVFFIIGLTNIYLAHVFKEGKRIKEENDLII